MPMDRFLIAPVKTGLQQNSPPWLSPDDAFEVLQNAYVWRSRIRKRFGSTLMGANQLNSRLRASLASGGAAVGVTDGAGAATGNVRTILADATLPLGIGQAFSIGSQFYTVFNPGAGANAMLNTGAGTGTFNLATSAYVFAGAPALTAIFFYPSLPVMGLTQYLTGAINDHPSYGFDTRYAYLFSGSTWARSGTLIFTGTDLNYVWAANWQSIDGVPILFVTNFNYVIGAATPPASGDPIWSLNGATWTAALGGTANAFYFRPNGGAPATGPYVSTARIIVAFKNRLILLNTVENDNAGGAGTGTTINYYNRARYSFYGSPFAVNAWYEKNQTDNVPNVAAGGGFVDAATEEQIVSVEFIKDRLIVYFERSTWELVYTNNQVLPFVWQKINTELGAMSTFSSVPFDKNVLGIGQSGVHACAGQNVVRIDEKIPEKIFEFETQNSAPVRTAGIRDYPAEMVYWSYVEEIIQPLAQKYNNQILVYNYKNDSWAANDDCCMCFGYFEQGFDLTWATSDPITWQQADFDWFDNVHQANSRQIIFGTPEGFILLLNTDTPRNAPSMQITNMTLVGSTLTLTIINHNLIDTPQEFPFSNDFILIENVVGDAATMAALNDKIFSVSYPAVPTFNTITIDVPNLAAVVYNGGGTAARVSNIQIGSKQWNPYVDKDMSFYLAKIDFAVVKTTHGEINVDYFPSSSDQSMITAGQASASIMGTGILETRPYSTSADPINLYPMEEFQSLLWHPIYFQSVGTFIQIGLSFDYDQMTDPNVVLSPFEIQALALYTQPTSSRMQ